VSWTVRCASGRVESSNDSGLGLHGWPFHGSGAAQERKEGEKGKRRRKEEMRWRPDEWGPLVGDSRAG
jgi:hypothetical protein